VLLSASDDEVLTAAEALGEDLDVAQSEVASRRAIFRQIAQRAHVEWPTYDSAPIYDRTSLVGLRSDVRVVSTQLGERLIYSFKSS